MPWDPRIPVKYPSTRIFWKARQAKGAARNGWRNGFPGVMLKPFDHSG
jgi:hypothetical protein